MTGICKFASRLQSKGINLADRRLVNSKKGTVNIDLLLGADYYDPLVSPFHRPKHVCGMCKILQLSPCQHFQKLFFATFDVRYFFL